MGVFFIPFFRKGDDIMRLPNGYGSVTKLSGNRRNPFWVRKTTGFDEKGHPIYLTIGYTETRELGLAMLAEYNKNPYDVDKSKITFEEIYLKWTKSKKYERMAKSTKSGAKTIYNKCGELYKVPYKEIKKSHMQEIVDASGKYSSQVNAKALFKNLDLQALELDVIEKMYSDLITTDPAPVQTNRIPFTVEEVEKLWANVHLPWVDTVLMYIYSGFRLNELLELETEKVDLDAGTFQGGSKSQAGKDRIIPIHSKIFEMVKKRAEEGNQYLISHNGKKVSETMYRKFWSIVMNLLGMDHIPHECRYTFRSRLDSAGANKVAIDRMMGHRGTDIGERVYTHKTIEELKAAIELMTY